MQETPPSILEYASAARPVSTPLAAWSLLIGGALTFLAPFVIAIYTDALFIDLAPLLLGGLGLGMRRGNRTFAARALAVTSLSGLGYTAAFLTRAMPVSFSVRPVAMPAVRMGFAMVCGAWSVGTALLLIQFLWPSADPVSASRRRRAMLVLTLAYGATVGGLGLQRRLANRAMRTAPVTTTDVQAVDAETGTPLPTAVGGPPADEEDPWGLVYSSAAQAPGAMRLQWTARKPLPVSISSPGYAEQPVTLDTDAGPTTVVRLRRLGSPATAPSRRMSPDN